MENKGITSQFGRAVSLVKICFLSNLLNDGGNYITPLLSGGMGQGKSSIARKIASQLSGDCFVVDGGQIEEGEITGFPYLSMQNGTSVLNYAPHAVVASIKRLQKYYYDIATTKGFLGGKIKYDPKTYTLTYPSDANDLNSRPVSKVIGNDIEKTLAGEDNQFAFGDELPGDLKLALIKSKELKPVVLFFDEINRTDVNTMKNLMNICLNKIIHDYNLPWWTFIMAAENPAGGNFTTQEMDPAQLDRFVKIPVKQGFEEWLEYQLSEGNSSVKYLTALEKVQEIFSPDDSKGSGSDNDTSDSYDIEDVKPTPRSHEALARMYKLAVESDSIKNSGFFDDDEKKNFSELIKIIIFDKIGKNYALKLETALQKSDDNIDPQDILTGKSEKLDKEIVDKFSTLNVLSKKIVSYRIIKYLATDALKYYVQTSSYKIDIAKKAKLTWNNIGSQLSEFFLLLSEQTANSIYFVKEAYTTNVALPSEVYENCKIKKLYNVEEAIGLFINANNSIKELSGVLNYINNKNKK